MGPADARGPLAAMPLPIRLLPDARHPLLPPRHRRPRSCAANESDEFAAFYPITSSARKRVAVGTSKPRALAVSFRISSPVQLASRTAWHPSRSCPRTSKQIGVHPIADDAASDGVIRPSARWKTPLQCKPSHRRGISNQRRVIDNHDCADMFGCHCREGAFKLGGAADAEWMNFQPER